MDYNNSIHTGTNNYYPKEKYYYMPDCIGPGSLGNEQVKKCKICSQNGYYNESIVFQNHNGKWIPLNYYNDQRHQHRGKEEEGEFSLN